MPQYRARYGWFESKGDDIYEDLVDECYRTFGCETDEGAIREAELQTQRGHPFILERMTEVVRLDDPNPVVIYTLKIE